MRLQFQKRWSKVSVSFPQVDLGNQFTKVTAVATQGRSAADAQWVTKYTLQYSNDGVSFEYYTEQWQIKVPEPAFTV